MLNRNSALVISIIAIMASPAAFAQNGHPASLLVRMGDDAGIVVGQPCEAVEKTQSVTPLSDGTTITAQSEERKWRDAAGRFRKEGTEVEQGQAPVFHTATIVDPVNNTLIELNLDRKTATVFHLPDYGPNSLKKHVDDFNNGPMWARPGVQVKVEKLDGKYIAGVYAVGRRVTRIRPPGTIGNDQAVVSVSERWVSPDLKILLATSMDDPRQKLTREVTHLDRNEPDPSLFVVPSDFTVKDVPAN